ncbi:MAG: adenylate kinase family protein, partial [Planctomycetota bacterium]
GFPRTTAQAEALDKALADAGVTIDAVVFVDVPDEVVFDRMTGRRLDPETGKIYAMSYNPPPAEIADRVIQRPDDNPDAVKIRLEKYHAETEPVTEFYGAKGLVKEIDGQQKPEDVTAKIMGALDM